MAWRCAGKLAFEAENPDDYDLLLLDQEFAMLRAKEHSAQIPGAERECIENAFKSDNERINTLVCTPTLEMGVTIGALDAVLTRTSSSVLTRPRPIAAARPNAEPTSYPVRGVAQPPCQVVTVRAIDQKARVIRRIAPNDRRDVHQPHARGLAGVARQCLRIHQA